MNHPYLPVTPEDLKVMLETIGVASVDELYKSVPQAVQLKTDLKIGESQSEIEIRRSMAPWLPRINPLMN